MKSFLLTIGTLFISASALVSLATAADEAYAVKGATVHTMAGPTIENGTILVRNGKITGVGKNLAIPKEFKVIDGKGLSVYPGMIDSGTELGLTEISSVRETSDTTEIGKFNPQLVALTAVNPSSEHIPVARVNGITTVASMPQGQLISGQVSLMHLDGWTTDEMGVKKLAGLHLQFPTIGGGGGRRGGGPPPDMAEAMGLGGRASFTEQKKVHEKDMAELNDFFESARRYKLAKDAKAPGLKMDLKLEAMIPVIDGKEVILITANREREIKESLEWAAKQKVKMILIGAIESYKCTKEIKAANVPVVLGPTLALPNEEDEPYDGAFTTPATLQKAGIKFAFASLTNGNTASRNLPFQAAQAVAFGLPHDEAILALTKNSAEIWGVGDQIGTIEEGKWADLLITDGDPLEAKTQIKQLFIKGKPVELDNKQKRLYDKYMARPTN